MVQEEHGITYGGGEATRESLKKVKPDKAPHRGLGIAELEKIRKEESQIKFSRGTELVFHPLHPKPNTTVPFLPGFDPNFPFGYIVENFPILRPQLLDSSESSLLVSSDGTMPLLWSSFQNDTLSSSNSQLPLVASELKQLPQEPLLLFPLQKHELHQQISQVVNQSSLHSVPGELDLPSNQSRYGIANASSWADQQLMMHQIVAMNHPCPFQMEADQNQRVIVPEPMPISSSNCGIMVTNGTQEKNTDWSIDCALSLHNVGVNLNINHPTVKRNGASGEDIAAPIDRSTLSSVCLPSVCPNDWPPKSMSIRQFSEMNATKRQKKTQESAVSKASSVTPSNALSFHNFMELPYIDYVTDRNVIANRNKRRCEGSDAVDVDLKL